MECCSFFCLIQALDELTLFNYKINLVGEHMTCLAAKTFRARR